MKVLSIDGGQLGALLLMEDKKIIDMWKMPLVKGVKSKKEYDIPSIVKIFESSKPDLVILEKTHVMPINGKISCFKSGFCFGMMQGILTTLRFPFKIVHSKTWQKEVLRDINGTDTKQKSLLFCQRMYPDTDWFMGCKKAKDGLTDAACMAYYGFLNN